MKSGIYRIRNIRNGKLYIGSAVFIEQRWRNHKHALRLNKHHSLHLQASWNVYGENLFVFEIIEFVTDKTKLIEREQFWIDELKSSDKQFGYNVCKIAGSALGRKASEETKTKRSQAMKGHSVSIETRAKISKGNKGNKNCGSGKRKTVRTKEHAAAIGLANKGKKRSTEVLAKMSLSQIGRKHSEETIKKLSVCKIGNESRRNKSKWSCELGCRCNCKNCLKKKSDNLAYRRQQSKLLIYIPLNAVL
jgi:group I intron endonuclease